MKQNLMVVAWALFLVPAACMAQAPAPAASPTVTHQQVMDKIWTTIDEKFYDPAFAGVDWKAVRAKYAPQVAAASSDSAFLRLMLSMMHELPVSHLELTAPSGTLPFSVPMTTRLIGGQYVIAATSALSDAYAKGVAVGDVLLSTGASLRGALGTNATVDLERCDGSHATLSVRRERFTATTPASGPYWFTLQQGSRNIGYLRMPNFFDGTADIVDKAMADLAKTDAIIIDVRDNPGGNMSFVRLSSYFTPGEHLVTALLTRGAIERRGGVAEQIDVTKDVSKVQRLYTDVSIFRNLLLKRGALAVYSEDMGGRTYRGRVAVLVNDNTASAAEGFAGSMQFSKAATLIGSPTAGKLLGGERFDMGGGWSLFMPTHAAWGPDGRSANDKVTQPDIRVDMTRRDVCDRKDPILARAVAELSR